jgi:hypothetical protein
MRSICAAILTVFALGASAQPDDQSETLQSSALAPELELPPRYRIEFIVFAHNRFDATEEYFDVVPATSQFAPSDEPIPMRFFDADERQALLDSIEGPIVPPPSEEIVPDGVSVEGDPPIAVELFEAWIDPRMVAGPNTRYLELHELELLDSLDRLEELDAYTPLIHAGWEQNGLPEAEAVALSLEEFGAPNPRGTLRLHMSRYLHMTVDLAYRNEPLLPESDPLPGFNDEFGRRPLPQPTQPAFGFPAFESFEAVAEPEYYLLEQRRILRGELNYFDHPAFGLLLQITLAPEPELEEDIEADGPSA